MIKDARWDQLPRQPAGLPAPPTHMRLKPNPLIQSGLKGLARVIPAATHIHWASAHHAAIASTSTGAQASVSFGIVRAVRVRPCAEDDRSSQSSLVHRSLGPRMVAAMPASTYSDEQHRRWLHGVLAPCVCGCANKWASRTHILPTFIVRTLRARRISS
jgi:hypothetical protein